MKLITVIGYKIVLDTSTNKEVRIYDDSTEKVFLDEKIASIYVEEYLRFKYPELQIDMYEREVTEDFDVKANKIADTFAKLTPEELELLNLKPNE